MRALGTASGLMFEGVAKRYGEITALQPTDLAVHQGEFFALLGPSGSGKTTLLGIVAGFIAPSAGRVLVNGADITHLSPERRNVGMVFQNYSLFPFMTVAANVAFPLEMRREPKARIAERVRAMLDMVRLGHLADRLPGELSGGQQQRVALARAAVYNPTVLLMDEPLGALDKNLRQDMQEEIRQFHRTIGATIIYVTHDQEEAAFMADRVAILNHGRIVQFGTQAELYSRPRNAFVARFLGEANLLHIETCDGDDAAERWLARTREGIALSLPGGARAACAAPRIACIRPADISVSTPDADCPGAHRGTVTETVPMADTVRHRIRLNERCQIVARMTTKHQRVRFEPGDAVQVRWEPGDVLFLPE